jgi:hypothetical protein
VKLSASGDIYALCDPPWVSWSRRRQLAATLTSNRRTHRTTRGQEFIVATSHRLS